MVGSMFAAISGLKSHQTRMDVIGNNIANVNTWGYKSQSANFMDATYRTQTQGKGGNVANGTGGTNASQIGYGANVGSTTVNYSTGNWSPTGLPSDCMIDGPAWFMVSSTGKGLVAGAGNDIVLGTAGPPPTPGTLTEDGEGKVYLSKVGIFRQDSQGFLVDAMGSYILDSNGQLIVGEVTGTGTAADPYVPVQYSSISISSDGKITGIRAGGNDIGSEYVFKTAEIGAGGGITYGAADAQIGLAVPTNVNGLEKTQGYYLKIGDNAGNVALGAQNVATGQIKSGYLEMSNVDLSNEMATMITTQRGFQANTKIITVTDEMLEQLVNMKR